MREELIYPESPVFDAIATQDTVELGKIFHTGLLIAAENGSIIPQTFYALTATKLLSDVCHGETFPERAEQAKQFGRDASAEFGQQPIHYIIQQAMCFETDENSKLKPNEDPNRKESCYTFVTPILGLCTARSVREHMEILFDWDQRVWSHKLHEGLPIEAQYDGSRVVTSTNKDLGRYNKSDPNIAVIDNMLLNEAIVGLSASFPGVTSARRETPLEMAISLELMKKQADEIHAESLASD